MKRKHSGLNSNSSSEPATKHVKQLPNTPPDDVVEITLNFLRAKDKIKLLQTSNENRQTFQPHSNACQLLKLIANGEENAARNMLEACSTQEERIILLTTPSYINDYAGRTFTNVIAYDYPHWAKDWHMCEILRSHMDSNDITRNIFKGVEAIEGKELTYMQNGEAKTSVHFDFTPLKKAYEDYFVAYAQAEELFRLSGEMDPRAFSGIDAHLAAIGKAQSDVPLYVIQEFNRPDRTFASVPNFDELNLPRDLVHRYNDFQCRLQETHCDWRALIIDKSFRPVPSLDRHLDWNSIPEFAFGDGLMLTRGPSPHELKVMMSSPHGMSAEKAYEQRAILAMDFDAVTRLEQVSSRKVEALQEELRPRAPGLNR